MDLLKELTAYGQSLELTGADLQRFIREQQAHLRELRVEQRERQKEDRDYELKREKLEVEKRRLEEKKSLDALESKYQAIVQELKYQLSLKETESKVAKRFERYAIAQKWNEGKLAVNLSALLKGRALDVYALLPQEKALDYAALKTALLKRFEKTEDSFREYFRRCRPEVGETFTQFAVRLGSYLDRWIEFGKVNKTYNGLYDLVLRDQFISICNRDLSLFLKERIPKSIEEMCMLADQFKEARHVNILTLVSSSKKETTFENRNPVAARDQRSQKEQVPPKTNGQSFSRQKKTGKDIRCYKCSRLGHIASQCKQSSSKNQSFAVKADTSSESGSSLKEHRDSV
ncbi:uncharacterized protein LOC134260747 [Saccostrea cucullata]|uniref:uncharacterized protein LOC134260747 n=1 Tax=Saccostrea cuccullata TaxID=36930 RepID=UPI002ED0A237